MLNPHRQSQKGFITSPISRLFPPLFLSFQFLYLFLFLLAIRRGDPPECYSDTILTVRALCDLPLRVGKVQGKRAPSNLLRFVNFYNLHACVSSSKLLQTLHISML